MGSLENMIAGTKASNNPQMLDKKPRPQQEQALKCPRCDSANTKFCYYNNYSLSQPRYFCKSCRRYWTKGGTLRNVPVGGGCRKNKRSSSSTNSKRANDDNSNNSISPLVSTSGADKSQLGCTGSDLSHLGYESNYLTLAFARLQQQKQNGQFSFDVQSHDLSVMTSNIVDPHGMISSPPDPNSIHTSPAAPAFLDALRSGFLDNPSSNFTSLCYNSNASNTNAELELNSNPFGDEDHMSMSTSGGATTTHGGFPWQNVHIGNGGGECNSSSNHVGVGDVGFDSGREIWNHGLGSSTNNWQYGLLNSASLI